MEKINITFYGDSNSELSYLKDILDDFRNERHLYTPENITFVDLSYTVFEKLLEREDELFCSIYTNNIRFLIDSSNTSSYLDVYKKNDSLTFLMSFFIENIFENLCVRNRLKNLFAFCKTFSIKYNFRDFDCKLYEDDDDFFFNSFGFSKMYYDIREGSDKLI